MKIGKPAPVDAPRPYDPKTDRAPVIPKEDGTPATPKKEDPAYTVEISEEAQRLLDEQKKEK
ncbi:hypothetical protein HOF40_00225 [Candidatus Parcubacteria bacterium]|jgi:hypothetical protein|nr:hypothetical protein [Candidatus Parcubacteria bacterium]MBT3948497.1 hypothetical protein [Candidatus Parcubacteria bacterium]